MVCPNSLFKDLHDVVGYVSSGRLCIAKLLKLSQAVNQRLSDAVGEVFQVGVAARVLKWQDGDGLYSGLLFPWEVKPYLKSST